MALVDLSIRPGYIGGSSCLLRVTVGRISAEGWTTCWDGKERFIWFEAVMREGWFEPGGLIRWQEDRLLDEKHTFSGWPVME